MFLSVGCYHLIMIPCLASTNISVIDELPFVYGQLQKDVEPCYSLSLQCPQKELRGWRFELLKAFSDHGDWSEKKKEKKTKKALIAVKAKGLLIKKKKSGGSISEVCVPGCSSWALDDPALCPSIAFVFIHTRKEHPVCRILNAL